MIVAGCSSSDDNSPADVAISAGDNTSVVEPTPPLEPTAKPEPTSTPDPPPTPDPAPTLEPTAPLEPTVAPAIAARSASWSCTDPPGDVDAVGGPSNPATDALQGFIELRDGQLLGSITTEAQAVAYLPSGGSIQYQFVVSDTPAWSSGESVTLLVSFDNFSGSIERSTGVRVDAPSLDVTESGVTTSLTMAASDVPPWVLNAPQLFAGASAGGFIEGTSLVDECCWTDVGLSPMIIAE